MTKIRNRQIDIARGLGIFSVVLGHIATGLGSHIIYLFHMPFFFMVSGYFHKVDPKEFQYLRKKALSLLIPYFAYLLILELPNLTRLLSRIIEAPTVNGALSFVKYLVNLAYGGETLTGETGVFWFITCLFLTQQLFNFISNRIKSPKIVVIIAAILYMAAYIDQISPGRLVAPWAVNVVGCAFLFYTAGALYGKYIFSHHTKPLVFGAIAIAVASIALLNAGVELSFGMKHAYYGYFILSTLVAFALTKLLALGSQWLAQHKWPATILAYLGTAAITIMYLHRFIEYNLPEFLQGSPLFQAVVITLICCGLHALFLQTDLSRRLLLGSFKKHKQGAQNATKPLQLKASRNS
ncbi:MAG: acyltransferase family protein [Cyanobacteria bacterium P01_F01_bin.53]